MGNSSSHTRRRAIDLGSLKMCPEYLKSSVQQVSIDDLATKGSRQRMFWTRQIFKKAYGVKFAVPFTV